MSRKIRRKDEPQLFAEVESKFALEGIDVDYLFACDGLVSIWDPVTRTAAPEMMRDSEAELVVLYLKKRGRAFSTMKDAEAHYASFAPRSPAAS